MCTHIKTLKWDQSTGPGTTRVSLAHKPGSDPAAEPTSVRDGHPVFPVRSVTSHWSRAQALHAHMASHDIIDLSIWGFRPTEIKDPSPKVLY